MNNQIVGTFTQKVTAAGSLLANSNILLTDTVTNDSEICDCRRALKLKNNQLFVEESATYEVSFDGTMTPTPGAYIVIGNSNGKNIEVPIDTTASGVRSIFLKRGTYLKLMVGSVAIPYLFNAAAPFSFTVTVSEQRGW